MEVATHLSGTDEEELVDVEGGIDDVISVNDISVCDNGTADRDCDTPVTEIQSKQVTKRKVTGVVPCEEQNTHLFTKVKYSKKIEKTSLQRDEDIAKWWSGVTARKTNRLMENKLDDETDRTNKVESNCITLSLNPMLQDPVMDVNKPSSLRQNEVEEEIYYNEAGEAFTPPTEETELPHDSPTQPEKEYFSEFFNGRTRYTPDKYLFIRNAILKMWMKKRPEHVYKVALRPVLKKDCGNVNNVGRIHRYLESIGAINFGSDNVWWKRKKSKKKIKEPEPMFGTDDKLKRALEQRMSGRSRKKPSQFAFDPAADDLIGGYTIDHANNDAILLPETLPKTKKQNVAKTTMQKYQLVNCQLYDSYQACPFDVAIDASSLLVMDTHSHLSRHEVMGLLGGYVSLVDDTNKKAKVHVVCAQPCRSSGSTRHCEMDPVSQSIACEYLTTRGLKVVGWYHSHPTFPPQPSITDIATQLNQQSMFTSHGSVFLGLILSPYNKHHTKTQVNVVHISDEIAETTGHETPYQIPYSIISDPPDVSTESYTELLRILTEIVEDATRETKMSTTCRLSHLLEPVVQGSSVTHLDKLTRSLSAFVASPTADVKDLSSKLDPKKMNSGDNVVACDVLEANENGVDLMLSSENVDTVMTSQPDNDVTCFCDETMAYSLNENFPSLSNDNICIDENNGLQEIEDCDIKETAYIRQQDKDDEEKIHPVWKNILEQLRSLLLRSQESISCS